MSEQNLPSSGAARDFKANAVRTCKQCGEHYTKSTKDSWARFIQRSFCGRKCQGIARRAGTIRAFEEPAKREITQDMPTENRQFGQ